MPLGMFLVLDERGLKGINDLTDEEWAMRVRELEWVRKEEAKANRL